MYYVRFSKLLSATLDQLYTTSQRRGGEEKILRLDRDLRVWFQNFNAALNCPSFDLTNLGESLDRTRLQRFGDSACGIIAWLDIMANYAMVMIHRPALTFDPATQRFRESLSTCVKSASAILQLSSATSFHQKASYIAPLGPSVIFQSALMHIFYRCSLDNGTFIEISPRKQDTLNNIAKAVRLLQEMTGLQGEGASVTQAIENSIALLQHLSDVFLKQEESESSHSSAAIAETYQVHVQPAEQGLGSIVIPHAAIEQSFETDFWNTSALENLNHLDIFWESLGEPG